MQIEGKNVIFIGGFGGVGSKCSELFLRKSVKSLIIFDRLENEEFLSYLQNTYKNSFVGYVQMNLAKRETISKAFLEAHKMVGHFDIVVNGAGVVQESNVDLMVAVNLTGVIHSSLDAMEYMSIANGGHGGLVVNISSTAGLGTFEIACVYSASTCAVTSFTRSIASPIYNKKTGVNFITVCPGPTRTPMFDNLAEKTTVAKYSSETLDEYVKVPPQCPEALAINFMRVLETGKNGSIWVLENEEMHEIDFPSLCHPIRKTG
ncbi:alcohol dehydrogenase [Stomoxys calcitrans]|uniref:Alcohol dehydrogenase n=1 Tax=Stomoxys calcitrans TaxID=35570 RepID=A0A1I8QCE1_STOCA|nr:alcohol dehydrogenase [Stomoxys calcitrans]